ncbi:MAG: double zinc ribbon domain-containing protein [Candidatus Helarchaeota archaeon]
MAYESLLMCKKCHTNLVIPKRVVVKKLTVYVWAKCAHCRKNVRFTVPLPQVHEWVDAMAENFFRCPKCGVTGVVTRTIQSGDFTKLKLYCSSCQKAFIKVANSSIYSYLMASHYNRMKIKSIPQGVGAFYIPSTPMPPISPASMASPMPTVTGNPSALNSSVPTPPTPPAPPAPPHLRPPAPPPGGPPAPPIGDRGPKICTNCHAPLPPHAAFCRKCGVPVEEGVEHAPRCPFCGATLSPSAQICPKCSSEVRCLKCDSLLTANARYCVKCGEPIKGKVEEVEAPVLTCHFCGAALELDQKVCHECGKPVVCPNCGNHLKSGIRFCNKCGTNVSEITMTTPEFAAEEEEELEENDEGPETPAKTIKCQNCGATMSEIYTFCTICGTKLEK